MLAFILVCTECLNLMVSLLLGRINSLSACAIRGIKLWLLRRLYYVNYILSWIFASSSKGRKTVKIKSFHFYLLIEQKVWLIIKMRFDDLSVLLIHNTWPFWSHRLWADVHKYSFLWQNSLVFLFRYEKWINKILPFIFLILLVLIPCWRK